MQIDLLKSLLQQRLTEIAWYMFSTMGFPAEMFDDEMKKMNGAEQLLWVNEFTKRHPDATKTIYYK